MIIISASSMIVTVLIGKLNTAPRQAHCIFCLFKTLCKTPMRLTDITMAVNAFVNTGWKFKAKASPSPNSMNA